MAEEPGISQEAHGSYIAQAAGGGTATIQVYTSPPTLADQNRARFLVRLRTRYRDLLEQSLQGAVRLTLGLAGHPEEVTPPVRLLYQSEQHATHPLPAGTSIAKIYADAGQELLVLGEPGAGKSTLLLELACDLVQLADQDRSQLLPVILPLSSWASKRLPLEQWLSEQIALLYDLPRRLSERWVQEERLLPLLDGLDEMEEEARATCIAAINTYHHEHLHPLVVASRKAEYEAAAVTTRLVLHSAVVVQPLTREQVDVSLMQGGEPVAALRTMLQEKPGLRELATTPLMLSILLLTYHGEAVHDLPATDSLPEQQRQIFAHYVERMIGRKGKLARFSSQDLVCWLQWLAQQMRRHDQPIFYLEHLQPTYLTSAQPGWYGWLAVRLPAILIGIFASLTIAALFGNTHPVNLLHFAALGGLLGWLFSRPVSSRDVQQEAEGHHRQGRLRHFGRSILPSIITGLIVGLSLGLYLGDGYGPGDWLRDGSIYGVVIGMSSLVLSWLLPAHPSTLSMRTARRWPFLIRLIQTIHGQRAWRVIATVGVGYGLIAWLSARPSLVTFTGLILVQIAWLSYVLGSGIISVFVSLILEAQTEGIALTERLHWTWHGLLRGLLTAKHMSESLLVIGGIWLISGLGAGLSYMLIGQVILGLGFGLGVGLIFGLSLGLSYWILIGLFQGVSSEQIEDRARRLPNQGVRRSLHNSVLMALISSGMICVIGILSIVLIGVLFSRLSYGQNLGSSNGLADGLSLGVILRLTVSLNAGWLAVTCGGLLVFASRGGLAVVRHYVIRLLLARSHTFPWQAPRFLEEATARILLRRVGGGYSFPHRLLLDYFADLPHKMP